MQHIVTHEEDYLTRTLLRDWHGESGYHVPGSTPSDPTRDCGADLVHPGTPLSAISDLQEAVRGIMGMPK